MYEVIYIYIYTSSVCMYDERDIELEGSTHLAARELIFFFFFWGVKSKIKSL